MYDSKILVERIKERAASQGIGIVQLHQMCGMSRNVVSQTANRKKGMTAENLCSIAEKLNCSADYLLGRTESPDKQIDDYFNELISHENSHDSHTCLTKSFFYGIILKMIINFSFKKVIAWN